MLLAAALLGGGCTSVNRPLNDAQIPLEHWECNRTTASLSAAVTPADAPGPVARDPRSDGYFVGLAISGGGSRSANFSAACIQELRKIGFMRHVDYISSVSGGSATAACYCAWTDAEWTPQNVQSKLTHSFATDLLISFLMPWNMFALAFSDYDRSDLIARSFRSTLFTRGSRELTFADLRADRPRLLMNATDLQSGRRFVFCNERFDELNSDLASYPLAYGVAASAAVPIIMHQVTLRDFSTTFDQFFHLVDGAVADNLGVQTLGEVYERQLRQATEKGQPPPYPRGAVLVVLDASTNSDVRISNKGDTGLLETIQAGAGIASKNLLNRSSSATLAEMILRYAPDTVDARTLRAHMAALQLTGYLELTDREGNPVRIIHVGFFRVRDASRLPFSGFGESLNSIATYWNIDGTEAYYLYRAADLLINESYAPQFHRIVQDLDAALLRSETRPASGPLRE